MNGPIILNNAREQLADEIFAHREPNPSPLKISPWLAMSLLQKAIRRGERELAQRAAATLLLIAPDRLWRRCGAAAFEEIGVADLETISVVTAALAGKKYRTTIGGDWKVASFIVDKMARAPKCRAADDLLLVADLHPRYQRARRELSTKTAADLIRISTGDAELLVRALAAWYAVGTRPGQSKQLAARRGDPHALFDGLCEAGLPHSAVEIAREGFRRIGEPLCPFVALLCPERQQEAAILQDDTLPGETMIGEVACWAYDMYSREGQSALRAFLQGESATAKWVRDHIARPQRLHFLGTLVFRVEGGLVRQRSRWSTSDELRRLVDVECNGAGCSDATELLQLMQSELHLLNGVRAHVS